MMKDKALEELFLAQRPQFDDKEEFMVRLNRKLDVVEYLHRYEEANLRRYKYAMVAVFVLGVVIVCLCFVNTFGIAIVYIQRIIWHSVSNRAILKDDSNGSSFFSTRLRYSRHC